MGECHYNDEYEVATLKIQVQAFIASEIQRLFSEEELAFEFTEGLVRRRDGNLRNGYSVCIQSRFAMHCYGRQCPGLAQGADLIPGF